MFVGLISVVAGCWVFRSAWRKYHLRRRTGALVDRARELATDVEPGQIIRFEGRIVGGSLVEPSAAGGAAQYSDHLLVEDDRGRVIRLGVPGRNHVPGLHLADEAVFAVGELAQHSEGSTFRSSREVDTLIPGREQILWIGQGDRAAALRALRVGFMRSCGEGPVLAMAGFVLVLGGGFLGC